MMDGWLAEYSDVAGVDLFYDYFVKTWLHSRDTEWYEAASEFPSTNNGLERMNRTIKDANTFRKQLPFPDFVRESERAVTQWSTCPENQVTEIV